MACKENYFPPNKVVNRIINQSPPILIEARDENTPLITAADESTYCMNLYTHQITITSNFVAIDYLLGNLSQYLYFHPAVT